MKGKHKILEYPAVFEPAKEGGYSVYFPAFPGCVTFGRTFEEARVKAREVLELWLEELAESGERIPACAEYPIMGNVKVSVPPKIKISYAANNC